MWGAIAGAAANIGMGIAGSAMGASQSRKENRRQHERNKELMQMQGNFNESMMYKNNILQQQMFDKTFEKLSPKEQMKRLKDAGLNPALMNGIGAQGQGTTGGGSAASMGLNSAPDGGNVMRGMQAGAGMGMQAAMLKSQIDVNKAQANNLQADADKKKGVDTELTKVGIEKLIAETTNTTARTALTEIQTNIEKMNNVEQEKSHESRMRTIDYNMYQAKEEVQNAVRNNKIGEETALSVIEEIKTNAVGAALRNELLQYQIAGTDAGNKLTQRKTQEIGERISQEWQKIGLIKEGAKQDWQKLSNEDKRIAIETFKAEIEADYKGINNVAGKVIDNMAGELFGIIGKVTEAVGLDNSKAWKATIKK